MKIFEGITPLAERYDGFVVDLWGVVHDGVQAYPGVTDALAQLQAAGKRVVFLSNAPRRSWVVEELLARLGVPRSLYVDAVTSGEVAWEMLRDRTDLARPDVDHLHRLAAEWQLVSDLSFADLVLWVREPAGSWLAVAHMRPTTGATAHPEEVVGAVLSADAAGLLEPWTREGISFALRSGALAGAAAAGDPATYPAAVEAALGPEMAAGRRALAAFTRHPRVVHEVLRSLPGTWGLFSRLVSGATSMDRQLDRRSVRTLVGLLGG